MFSLILYFLIFKFSYGIEILSAREETNDLLSRKQNVSDRKSSRKAIENGKFREQNLTLTLLSLTILWTKIPSLLWVT